MNRKLDKLISSLFSDSENIKILCSIYENEVSAANIASLLNLTEAEVINRLKILYKNSLVSKRKLKNSTVYSLKNPKVCDSILFLRDSFEYIDRKKITGEDQNEKFK
jgi:DNA-binding transcriptional ArsR family regulator